jgi:hypothetical protein
VVNKEVDMFEDESSVSASDGGREASGSEEAPPLPPEPIHNKFKMQLANLPSK